MAGLMEQGQGCVDKICCDFWTEGCGCDRCFGIVADGLEAINPILEYTADCIWILGSPLAFPLVFCFPRGPETDPPGGGWTMPMIMTPCRKPLHCCFYTLCAPCGQWHMRREALGRDMTKYKLWQGMHDGPHCCARRCPSAPITIKAGTYGEQNCPEVFLCLEVTCLAGIMSTCCAFDVSRRLIRNDRNLGTDPTEERVNACVGFFSHLAHKCCMFSLCVWCASCLVGCCAPGSEGAQECSGEAGRASRACFSCVRTCWRGIWSVKLLAMGCMSAQQDHELHHGKILEAKPAPVAHTMERGSLDDERVEGEDEDAWWKKPPPPNAPRS